jgi:hypothetical protein
VATLQFYLDDHQVRIFPDSDKPNDYVLQINPDKHDLTKKKIEFLLIAE